MGFHPRSSDPCPRRPILVVAGPGTGAIASELAGAVDAEVIGGPGPSDAALVIVGHATPLALDEARAAHPGATIMAVLARETEEADVVALYRHGADLVVAPAPAALLVAHVHALLRRRMWSHPP